MVRLLIARPLPEQVGHGSSTMSPRPRHVLQGSENAKLPRFLLAWPDPSHVGQTLGTVPDFAPVPWHVGHGPSPVSRSGTVTPVTESLSESVASVSTSAPRRGRCCVPRPPPNMPPSRSPSRPPVPDDPNRSPRTGGRLGDLLGGMFGGGRGTQQRPRRGADVETEATLSFNDSVTGVTVPLRLTGEGPCPTCHGTGAKSGTVPRVCPTCQGTGQSSRNLGSFAFSEPCKECRGRGLVVDDPCPSCSGSGRAMSSRTIQARIPAGVADGQRIRLRGKGAPGESGGPAGDLYVLVHVTPHPIFGRSGDNLTVSVPVTFTEAALGAEVKVPSLRGVPVSVRIPAGTPSGRTFRARGKGARRKDGTNGDLLVTVNVQVPQNLNGAARQALESFRDATAGEDPREGLLRRARQP